MREPALYSHVLEVKKQRPAVSRTVNRKEAHRIDTVCSEAQFLVLHTNLTSLTVILSI